jgi:hypothetical protein
MKCEINKEQLSNWINNEMTEGERNSFELHLQQCKECRNEIAAMQNAWNVLGSVSAPAPSDKMWLRFDTMLNTYKHSLLENQQLVLNEKIGKIKNFLFPKMWLRLTFSCVLILIGLIAGYFLNRRSIDNSSDNKQIEALSGQVQEMREMVMLSLLQNPSASERIRGVNYTSEINGASKKVVDALFTTLNNDPNVNVRLMTLDALTQLTSSPGVREGLVESIMQQESPLMQAALADLMVKLQEKRSVQPMKKLLLEKNINQQVKIKIEQTIKHLI